MLASDGVIVLAGGVSVPVPALRLAWDLEERGCRLAVDETGGLLVGPTRLLSDEDRRAIAEWKPSLVAIVAYCQRWPM